MRISELRKKTLNMNTFQLRSLPKVCFKGLETAFLEKNWKANSSVFCGVIHIEKNSLLNSNSKED